MRSIVRRGMRLLSRARRQRKRSTPPRDPPTDLLVVHQMGKVGSTAYYDALRARLPRVYHTHHLGPSVVKTAHRIQQRGLPLPRHIREALALRDLVVDRRIAGRLRIITAMRDPIARNVSAFFQNLEADAYRGFVEDPRELGLEELRAIFLERFPHDEPLVWFDRHVAGPLGFDVFAHDFPRERGWATYEDGNLDVLVLQFERMREVGPAALSAFTEVDDLELAPANRAEDKWYAETYGRFVRDAEFGAAFLDRMYDNDVVRHFYTSAQIARFRERWGAG